jgi:TonB family protein
MRLRHVVVSALLLLVWGKAGADTCTWTNEPWSSVSSNGEWKLVVTPVATRKHDHTRAALYQKKDATWRRRARWKLVNRYGPMHAVVANNGITVTFDNRCSYGAGNNVVVIYRPDGTVVRAYALPDLLLERDISVLPRTVSSIYWSGTHRLDEEKRQLILQIKGPERTAELPISLETGEMLAPKKKLFVIRTFDPVVTYGADPADDSRNQRCEGGIVVGSAELISRASGPVIPAYPPVAVKARVQGDALLEIAVSNDGIVEKTVVRKSPPFGLDAAAEAAVRQWRFRPLQREGRPVRMCGRLVVHFGAMTVDPPDPD